MSSDDPHRQSTVVMKTFASGILMPPEKSPHLGNLVPIPHLQFSELPDKSSCLWVIVRLPFSPCSSPAYTQQRRNHLCLLRVGVLEPSICLSHLQPVSTIAWNSEREGMGRHLTRGPPSPATAYVQLYVPLLRWQTRDHGGKA